MKTLTIERFCYSIMGTFGKLYLPGMEEVHCYTLERQWQDNRQMISCIPEGWYIIRPDFFNRGGYPTWEVSAVPGRSEIKFHIGNTVNDVSGCIALGMDLAATGNLWSVSHSRAAFDSFMRSMSSCKGQPTQLIIKGFRP